MSLIVAAGQIRDVQRQDPICCSNGACQVLGIQNYRHGSRTCFYIVTIADVPGIIRRSDIEIRRRIIYTQIPRSVRTRSGRSAVSGRGHSVLDGGEHHGRPAGSRSGNDYAGIERIRKVYVFYALLLLCAAGIYQIHRLTLRFAGRRAEIQPCNIEMYP